MRSVAVKESPVDQLRAKAGNGNRRLPWMACIAGAGSARARGWLSLSYGIVQKHHGRIEVQSELGKGTTFRVWLPVRQPPAADAEK